jgi:hypothetical protein
VEKTIYKELNDLYSSTSIIRVIKNENELDEACSTYGGEQTCIQDVGVETCGKETTWKNQAYMGG